MSDKIEQTWHAIKRTHAESVTLTGPADVMMRGIPYRIFRVDVHTSWTAGKEEEGRTVAGLHVNEVFGAPNNPDATLSRFKQVLRPEQLTEVPDWLMHILVYACPRDVG